MHRNAVVSREDWFEAHRKHLEREKELTRFRDCVAAERRELPWLKIRKDYVFESEQGPKRLAGLFGENSQLIVYHFMLAPGSNHRCEGCSFLADHIDGANLHLQHHDVSLVVVSRAPLAELLPYKQRMGWRFDWVSSYASDFNFDMQVSFTDKQIAAGDTTYNFERRARTSKDLPGSSVFYRDEAGDIFLTFTSRARGGDQLIGAYHYLDMTPKGRIETGPYGGLMDWVRLHDEYEDGPEPPPACCD
ncbi:MAG: DUF899 domain-containing protein [Mesorhizobium sp.]|uniref:DUF899 domain-containing protein n=1 Tax=Mesorhizobium sp. TaxID=1871066 RepID=UPI000FD468AC|nr:thioredoxin family protein [Mesorhizobium sp.]RVD73162.1 DUF899 domain-containing protein [Mesorhizobium sp. M4A.F.Ca.ET.029.04.2.1]RWD05846.1 MAG: DUF899 domain-containing protein [Mesorhizobium sp.]TIW32927.1 MAG: DUF899 domain-containing protein [Mesorhizobium sp.]